MNWRINAQEIVKEMNAAIINGQDFLQATLPAHLILFDLITQRTLLPGRYDAIRSGAAVHVVHAAFYGEYIPPHRVIYEVMRLYTLQYRSEMGSLS